MNTPRGRSLSGQYLDVTEFILAQNHNLDEYYLHQQNDVRSQTLFYSFLFEMQIFTPDMHPIEKDYSHYQMSPFLKGLLKSNNDMAQFLLEEVQHEDDLQNIEQNPQGQQNLSSQTQQKDQKNENFVDQIAQSQPINYQQNFLQPIENIEDFKKYVQPCLYQHQIEIYSSQFRNNCLKPLINRLVGDITFLTHRAKVMRFFQKKKKRIWKKKVSYDCRKAVADRRIRIKGKFATKQQACQQLSLSEAQALTKQEINQLLKARV